MQMQDIRTIAKTLEIKSSRMGKAELIRAIQRQEGNFDCFGSASNGHCDQGGCQWREDCIPAKPASRKG